MADPAIAFHFLVGQEPDEVSRLGQQLNRLNGRRQKEEERILDGVRKRYAPENAACRTLVRGTPHGLPG